MIIKEVLKSSIEEINKLNIEDASMKVKMILSDILGKEKEYLLIHDNEELSQDVLDNFYAKLNRLKDEEPIQYILNKQEFMGFEFYVDENVLIPQPDTEILVEEVVDISKKINNNSNELRVLDMCTGSGAIAISLSKLIENASVSASDISDGALNVAKENAIKNSVNIEFYKSDLFNDISKNMKFDIIVSNPPYIQTEVIKGLSKEVQAEPFIALDGGEDGLVFYREIIKNAKDYIVEDGYLALEIGYDQKESVTNLLRENGYKNIYSKTDLAGNDRVVVGQK
jgi:release factor glutamine methyltransferase